MLHNVPSGAVVIGVLRVWWIFPGMLKKYETENEPSKLVMHFCHEDFFFFFSF